MQAIKDCSVVVLVFSSHSNSSTAVLREIRNAMSRNKVVVPFRIEEVEYGETLSWYISTTHWLDALTPPIEKHLNTLAQQVKCVIQGLQTADATSGADSRRASVHGAQSISLPIPLKSSGATRARLLSRWAYPGFTGLAIVSLGLGFLWFRGPSPTMSGLNTTDVKGSPRTANGQQSVHRLGPAPLIQKPAQELRKDPVNKRVILEPFPESLSTSRGRKLINRTIDSIRKDNPKDASRTLREFYKLRETQKDTEATEKAAMCRRSILQENREHNAFIQDALKRYGPKEKVDRI